MKSYHKESAHHLKSKLDPPLPSSSLQSSVRQLIRQAETHPEKAALLDFSTHRNLLPTLEAAIQDPKLSQHVAHFMSLLSVEYDASNILSQPPFIALLDVMLDLTVAPSATIRHASRSIRNITAHSVAFAHALARHSGVIRKLITILAQYISLYSHGADAQLDADSSEITAAIANFVRCDLQCQAYARKHGSLTNLVEVAMHLGHTSRFHACRALAEYSLQQKWFVQLVSEGCVGIMIRVLEEDSDEEIVSEAIRFLGNLAIHEVGRETILNLGGLERVINRLLNLSDSSQLTDLRVDLLRTASNLCVHSNVAALKLIHLGGLAVFIDSYVLINHPNVQSEAFRGMLIVAKASHAARATVLRDIGIKIRHEASIGRCVASLYDLLRRIKVEASTERADDFPQTIADLGNRSKQYLFRAGPLASDNSQQSGCGPTNDAPSEYKPSSDHESKENGVSEPRASDNDTFRPSRRLLSVQRPMPHRDRVHRDAHNRMVHNSTPSPVRGSELMRGAGSVVSPLQSPLRQQPPPTQQQQQQRYRHPPKHHSIPQLPSSIQQQSSTKVQQTYSARRPAAPPESSSDSALDAQYKASDEDGARVASESALNSPSPRGVEPRSQMSTIPRCRVIESGQRAGDDSVGHWVKAVWSAVCSAVSRPGGSRAGGRADSYSTGEANEPAERKSSDDETGAQEEVYEIGVPLGRGGFATVFLAKNLRTGDLVAVKRFHPPSGASHEVKRKAEVSLRRAIKEQRIWDGLEHRNVVAYKGCFFGEQGELNLVAEYIPGWSLADHLSQITKFPEHMVACITLQIVAGLEYLHRNGVTHRDVKPANILVNPDGVIKITDFGVSSAVDVPTMTGNTIVGTPWYIAPEMIEGRAYGKSVDVWSLGCTVMELATGQRPYHNLRPHIAMFRMTQDRMPPIPRRLSPILRDFLKTCWVWDAAQRPSPANLRRHHFLSSVSKPEVTNLKAMARKPV